MNLKTPRLGDVMMVKGAAIGAAGPEVFGGPQDGAHDPFMVLGQFDYVPPSDLQAEPTTIFFGFTKEAALNVAEQLQRAAAGL